MDRDRIKRGKLPPWQVANYRPQPFANLDRTDENSSSVSSSNDESLSLTQTYEWPMHPAASHAHSHLLAVSVLEQLCMVYQPNSQKAHALFKVLCAKLKNLGLISCSSSLDEMSSVRSQHRILIDKLIQAVINLDPTDMKFIPSSNAISMTTPIDMNPHMLFRLEDILQAETSRYQQEFREHGKIGSGGFGLVFKVKNKLDKSYYAVKKIRFRQPHPDVWLKKLREVKALAHLQHANIVRYHTAWLEFDPIYTSRERHASSKETLVNKDKSSEFGASDEEEEDEDEEEDSCIMFEMSNSKDNGKKYKVDTPEEDSYHQVVETVSSSDHHLVNMHSCLNKTDSRISKLNDDSTADITGGLSSVGIVSNCTTCTSIYVNSDGVNGHCTNTRSNSRSRLSTTNCDQCFERQNKDLLTMNSDSPRVNDISTSHLEQECVSCVATDAIHKSDFTSTCYQLHQSSTSQGTSTSTSNFMECKQSSSVISDFKKSQILVDKSSLLSERFSDLNLSSHSVSQGNFGDINSSLLQQPINSEMSRNSSILKVPLQRDTHSSNGFPDILGEFESRRDLEDSMDVSNEFYHDDILFKSTGGDQCLERFDSLDIDRNGLAVDSVRVSARKHRSNPEDGVPSEQRVVCYRRSKSYNENITEQEIDFVWPAVPVKCSTLTSPGMNWPPKFGVTLYIQMELCNLTLKEWLTNRNSLNPSQIDYTRNMVILKQILAGVDFIHSKGIVHRDLKPSNVFLQHADDDKIFVKIGDFGLVHEDSTSGWFDTVISPPANSTSFMWEHTLGVGTTSYAAPEQIDLSICDTKCDMYSIGVMSFELFSIWQTEMERQKEFENLRNKQLLPAEFKSAWPEIAATVLSLMSLAGIDRPSAEDLLKSKLFCSKNQIIAELEQRLSLCNKEIIELKEKNDSLHNALRKKKKVPTATLR